MDQLIEFAGNPPVLPLALVAILGMIAWSFIGSRLSGYQRIEPQAVVPLLNRESAVGVDVRDAKDFKEGHVVGAIHIPLSALAKRHVELNKFKEKPVVVACRSGTTASSACSLLRKQGFASVYLMNGGMLAWRSANLPLARK